jgi:hypothetical protein
MAFRQAVWGEHRSTERAEHSPAPRRRTRRREKEKVGQGRGKRRWNAEGAGGGRQRRPGACAERGGEGKKRLEALEDQERSLARPPDRKAAPRAAPLLPSTA